VPTTAPDQAIDYTTLTDKQLRGLYAKGVRNEHTRRANATYQRERLAARRPKTSGGGEDVAAHSADEGDTAAAAPAGLGATTGTPEPDAAPRNLTPPEPTLDAEPAPPRTPEIAPIPGGNVTSSIGTVRRLRGLAMIGVTPQRIAEVTRIHLGDIWWLLMTPPATVPVPVHNRVSDAFRTLRLAPITPSEKTTEGRGAAQIMALAEEHHWAGPFDWDKIDRDEHPVATHRHRDPAVLQAAIDAAPLFQPLAPVLDERELEQARALQRAAEAKLAELRPQLQRAHDLADELSKRSDARGRAIDGLKHDLEQERHRTAELRATIESQVRTIGDLRDDLARAQEDYENAVKAGDALLTEKQRLEAVLADTDLKKVAWHDGDGAAHTDAPSTIVDGLRKLIAPLSVSGITMHVTIGEPR
jgi:hypothetical protein